MVRFSAKVVDFVCWGGVAAFSMLIVYGVVRMYTMSTPLRPVEDCDRTEKEAVQSEAPYENIGDGDVWIKDFPMLDQDQLPWCQIYTLARIFNYYGFDVKPEDIGRELGVSTNQAPSVAKTKSLLEGLCQEAGLKLKETMPSWRVSSEFVDDYNAIAQRLYKPQLYKQAIIKDGPLDVEQLAAQLNVDVWMAYLDECQPERFGLFWRAIVESIDAKAPLVWSVILGFLKEERLEIRRGSGHMRVIVGYNPNTEEVLYSDSWGDRHKVKRMKVDDAYMITSSLWSVAER